METEKNYYLPDNCRPPTHLLAAKCSADAPQFAFALGSAPFWSRYSTTCTWFWGITNIQTIFQMLFSFWRKKSWLLFFLSKKKKLKKKRKKNQLFPQKKKIWFLTEKKKRFPTRKKANFLQKKRFLTKKKNDFLQEQKTDFLKKKKFLKKQIRLKCMFNFFFNSKKKNRKFLHFFLHFFYISFFVIKSSETYAKKIILPSTLFESGGGGVCRSLTRKNQNLSNTMTK